MRGVWDQVVVAWKDLGPVYVASNFADVNPLGKGSIYFSEEKKKAEPNTIKIYNIHMGGVDLLGSMVMCYAITIRNRKMYWAPYNWYINVSLVQACCLHPKVGGIMGIWITKRCFSWRSFGLVWR